MTMSAVQKTLTSKLCTSASFLLSRKSRFASRFLRLAISFRKSSASPGGVVSPPAPGRSAAGAGRLAVPPSWGGSAGRLKVEAMLIEDEIEGALFITPSDSGSLDKRIF
jgi:hypothetical protein